MVHLDDAPLQALLLDRLTYALLTVGRNIDRRKIGICTQCVLRDLMRIVIAIKTRLKRQRTDIERIFRLYGIQKAVQAVVVRSIIQMTGERDHLSALGQHQAEQARRRLTGAVVVHADKAQAFAARRIGI